MSTARDAKSPLDVFWDGCEGTIVFGVNDCFMVPADVIVAAGGPDLMVEYRGRYGTERGFTRAFRKAGHATLADACDASMAAHGAIVTEPQDFDIALIGYPSPKGATASPAFFHGGFWHVRSEPGGLLLAHSMCIGIPKIYRVV